MWGIHIYMHSHFGIGLSTWAQKSSMSTVLDVGSTHGHCMWGSNSFPSWCTYITPTTASGSWAFRSYQKGHGMRYLEKVSHHKQWGILNKSLSLSLSVLWAFRWYQKGHGMQYMIKVSHHKQWYLSICVCVCFCVYVCVYSIRKKRYVQQCLDVCKLTSVRIA